MKKKKKEFTLLFDSEKILSKQEMDVIKGGEICGNVSVGVPPYLFVPWLTCGEFYVALGNPQ